MKGHKQLQVSFWITTVAAVLRMAQPLFSQTYQVGVPVCDTISTWTYPAGPCSNDNLTFRLGSTLVPYVTGLDLQIVITALHGKAWSNFTDSLKVGEILPLIRPGTSERLIIFLGSSSSSFQFITKITGTPAAAYESYYCEIKQAQTTAACYNYLHYWGEGPICQVQPAVSVEEESDASIPVRFRLLQNYPNPFNAATTIGFDLNRAGEVDLRVFNLHGGEMATLINQKKFTAGSHRINWNAENAPSGIYVYRLQINRDFVAMRKLILLK